MAGSRRVTIEFLGDDKSASKTARSVDTTTSKLGDTFKKVGKAAAIGLGVGIAAAGTALVAFGKSAIEEAREAEKIGAQTNAVLKSTGGIANVTADEVANLAEQLSLKAGIDDELIQSGENVLLTFTNLRNEVGKGNDIFNQATAIALDMSVALDQDMKSASILVGKALNDPIKGLTALTRVGVSFTDKQKAVIEKLVESGDTLGAQKVILRELNKEFEGSAEAQATAGDKARVAWGNFQEFIGSKLLPILDDLAVFFVEDVVPALERFAGWVEDRGIPAAKRMADWLRDKLAPAAKWLRDRMKDLVDWVRDHWPEIRDTIKDTYDQIEDDTRKFKDQFQTLWQNHNKGTEKTSNRTWDRIKDNLRSNLEKFRNIYDFFAAAFTGDWGRMWTAVKREFSRIWKDEILGALKFILGILRDLVDAFGDWIVGRLSKAWDNVQRDIGRIGDVAVAIFHRTLDNARQIWGDIRAAVSAAVGGMVARVRRISSPIRAVFDAIGDAIGYVTDKVNDLIDAINSIPTPDFPDIPDPRDIPGIPGSARASGRPAGRAASSSMLSGAGGRRGPRTQGDRGSHLVAELHVYLDGKEIQNSLVKLKRRNGNIALGIA